MSTPTSGKPNDGTSTAPPTVYRVGDLVVDLTRERVTRGTAEIELSKLSFDLLATLVRAAPDLVPARKLMDLVWPGLVVGPETIVQRVKLVRDALGDDPRAPRYIGGVRGRGYRVVATVTPDSSIPALAGQASPPRRLPTRIAATAVAVLLLAATAAVFYATRSSSPALPDAATPTIAVLPFDNLSPGASDIFFADGLHDDVISALAESAPELRVIARATMTTYRSRPRSSASAIARELDATHVLAATVRRDTAVVRLTLELIDAATDTALWSHAYERAAEDTPTLRTAVAADVAARLSPRRDSQPQAAAITANAAAYDHYLRALIARPGATCIYLPLSAVDNVEQPLTTAIELDPNFGAAYAERAAVRMAKLACNFDTSAAHVQRIADDLAVAERVAPTAPKTLAARSWHLMWVEPDYEAALAAYAAAERAGLADPLWMLNAAAMLADLGRTDEALRVAEHALAIDPRSPVAAIYDAYALTAANRPVDAVRLLDFALAQSPDVAVRGMKAFVVFAFTGDLTELNAYVEDVGPFQFTYSDSALIVERAFHWYRWNARLDELAPQLDAMEKEELRSSFPGAGTEPLARYQGWTSLLRGDRESAAARGAEMLALLSATEETPRNRPLLRLLAAEAHTFAGEPVSALAAAREAHGFRETAGGTRVALDRAVAAVYAWNGADDAALDILERLTTKAPRVGPAEVARDPIFTLALADNARFAALVERLEAEMRAMRLE